jgi:hypothetical protein
MTKFKLCTSAFDVLSLWKYTVNGVVLFIIKTRNLLIFRKEFGEKVAVN